MKLSNLLTASLAMFSVAACNLRQQNDQITSDDSNDTYYDVNWDPEESDDFFMRSEPKTMMQNQ